MKRERDGIQIGEFEGFGIYYQRGTKSFVAYDKENREVASAETEEKLIAKIKAHLKAKWTPTEVISRLHNCVVTISSRSVDAPDREVWITWKDDEGVHKEKGFIESWAGPGFYEKTDENMKIIEKVQEIRKEEDRLMKEEKNLMMQLTKPYKLPPP